MSGLTAWLKRDENWALALGLIFVAVTVCLPVEPPTAHFGRADTAWFGAGLLVLWGLGNCNRWRRK